MKLRRWQKVILGFVGTIVLGAIGSGLWDLLGKGISQWVGRGILNVATFGSSAIVNSVYREAARGLHEESALQQYGLILLFVVLFGGGISVFFAGYARGVGEGEEKSKKIIAEIEALPPTDALAVAEGHVALIEKEIASLRRRQKRLYKKGRVMLYAWVSVLIATLSFNYARLSQANDTVTFFRQSIAICSPFVDDKQIKLLTSRFAAMNSKSDFLQIYGKLEGIAGANHLRLPDFAPL